MRILVCGGRDFDDMTVLSYVLARVKRERGISLIIHGAARGADSLAGRWATESGVPSQAFPADWKKHGKGDGPIRNQKMLDEGKPDAVIAFQGGTGTADMVRRAQDAGIPVWQPRFR